MTREQALAEAVNRWGEWGSVCERNAGQDDNGRRCEVGWLEPFSDSSPYDWPMAVIGVGPSWDEAFASIGGK